MSTMGCSEFIEQLDSWMDGDRDPAAQSHIKGCATCRGFAADLDAIQTAAPTLSVADPEPPERVWTSLRSQLVAEGLIREGAPQLAAEKSGWLDGFFRVLPRPAFAGAYLTILVCLAFGLSAPFAVNTPPQPSFPVSAQLDNYETTFSATPVSNSAVSAAFHQDLALVDHYIALCEKSVREDPDNVAAREYLYQAYQQKADLLAVMTERGDAIQ